MATQISFNLKTIPFNQEAISNINISFPNASEAYFSLLNSGYTILVHDCFIYLYQQKNCNEVENSKPSLILFIPNYELNLNINLSEQIQSKKFSCLLKSKYSNSNQISIDFVQNVLVSFKTQKDLNLFKNYFNSSSESLNRQIFQYSEQELSKVGRVKCLDISQISSTSTNFKSSLILQTKLNKNVDYCNLILLRSDDSYLLQLHGVDLASSNQQVICLLSMKLLPTTIVTSYHPDSYSNISQNSQNSNQSQNEINEFGIIKRHDKVPQNMDKTKVFSIIDLNEGISVTLSCESVNDTLSWISAIHAWKMQSLRKTMHQSNTIAGLNRNAILARNNVQVTNIKRSNLYQKRFTTIQLRKQIEFNTDDSSSSYYYSDDDYYSNDKFSITDEPFDDDKQQLTSEDKLKTSASNDNQSINEAVELVTNEVDNPIIENNCSAVDEIDASQLSKVINDTICNEKDICSKIENDNPSNELSKLTIEINLDESFNSSSTQSPKPPKMTVKNIISNNNFIKHDLDLDKELFMIQQIAHKEEPLPFSLPKYQYSNTSSKDANIDIESQIKELCNCAGSNIDAIFSSLPNVEYHSTKSIIEKALNPNLGKKEKDIFDCIKIDDFNSFDFEKVKANTGPVRPFVEEYSIAIQDIITLANKAQLSVLQKTGKALNSLFSNDYFHSTKPGDPNNMIKLSDNPQTFKLCFLICSLFLNGLKGFNSFGLEHEFLDALQELKCKNPIIGEIYNQVSQEKTILTQISVFVILLLNNDFLVPFLESILNEDEWISHFYSSTSYLRDEETIKQIIICHSILRNIKFDLPEDMGVIANSTFQDKDQYIFKSAYSYLLINDIKLENNKIEQPRKLIEFFLTEINVNKIGWQFLLQVKESNHVKPNADFQILKREINEVKNNCLGNDEKKVLEVIRKGLNFGLLHIWFIFLFTNQELVSQFFKRDSIFVDLYRAKYVLSELQEIISDN